MIENFLMPHPMDIIHYQGLVSSVPHHLKTLSGYSTGQFLNAEDELSFLTNLDFDSEHKRSLSKVFFLINCQIAFLIAFALQHIYIYGPLYLPTRN